MNKFIRLRFAGFGIMLAMCAVFGFAAMLLWNALLPHIFGLQEINYPQAVGLLVLARLLFGGLGGGFGNGMHGLAMGGRGRNDGRMFHRDGNILREKWQNMSNKEREEFIEKEKEYLKFNRRFSHFRDFFEDDKEKKSNEEEKKDIPNE